MSTPLESIQIMYEAFGKGDIPTILGYLDENVEWESWTDNYAQKAGVPWLIPRKGPAEVTEFFKVVGEMKFNHFEIKNIMAGGNQVALEIVLDVDIPSTGKRVADEEVHLWNFNEAGKVIRMRHYGDTAKHMKAAGVS